MTARNATQPSDNFQDQLSACCSCIHPSDHAFHPCGIALQLKPTSTSTAPELDSTPAVRVGVSRTPTAVAMLGDEPLSWAYASNARKCGGGVLVPFGAPGFRVGDRVCLWVPPLPSRRCLIDGRNAPQELTSANLITIKNKMPVRGLAAVVNVRPQSCHCRVVYILSRPACAANTVKRQASDFSQALLGSC